MDKKWNVNADFLFVETEQQTRGLTRKKNTLWLSKRGDLLFSFCFRSKLLNVQIMFLNFLVAQQIIEATSSSYKTSLKIKWPNDVYLHEEKIAGILMNVSPVKNTGENTIYIGVGVNTSENRNNLSKVKIDSKLLFFEKIIGAIKLLEEEPSLYIKKIQKEFIDIDYFGDKVLVHKNKKYRSIGIDDSGFLLIANNNETITIYDTKEIQYITK